VWRDIHSTGELISRVGIEAKTKVLSFGGLDTQSNPWGPVPSAISFLSAAAMVLLLAVGWMARRRIGAIEAFVFSTAVVVVAYAGAVPRFWIAAFPFLVAYVLIAAERLVASLSRGWPSGCGRSATSPSGPCWGVQSIELSTSGRQFPDRWEGQRAVSAAYRVAFGEGRPGDRANLMPAVVEELRRYEPLARPGPRS
jgi:hypothetical protein